MYVDKNIDKDYQYIAEINSSYVVLVRESTLNDNNTYDAYIQYFNPSTDYYFINNYKPKLCNANSYDLYYYYDNDYIDYVELIYTQNTNQVELDSDFFSRPDYANIIIGVTSICVLVSVVINCVTSLVIKGGLFRND